MALRKTVQLFACLSMLNVWVALSYYYRTSLIVASQQRAASYHHETAFESRHKNARIILCFPFHNELDILHLKLLTLSRYVDLFVIAESAYDDRGRPKALIYNTSQHEPRFVPFHSQIIHIIDEFVPQARDYELGWKMNKRMKQCIGDRIVSSLRTEHPDAIVIMGDADEAPSPENVQWLAQHGCARGTTYEYASTMPTYYYGFSWVGSTRGYSTLTARSMRDEAAFWEPKDFRQSVIPLPFYPSGWHCSYCMSSEACVQKLAHTNLADGPPFLGLYNWTTAIVDAMRACGVAAQGNLFSKNADPHAFSWAEQVYPYLISTAVCGAPMRLHVASTVARLQGGQQ